MGWNFLGTDWHLFGDLADIAFLALLFFAVLIFFYIPRLRKRIDSPVAEQLRAKPVVLAKVRKREPLTPDELDYATQLIKGMSTPWAFAIPGAVFSLGCFYALGSLEQLHGSTPSERTFLGVIAMFSALNITGQLFRVIKLNRRLKEATLVDAES